MQDLDREHYEKAYNKGCMVGMAGGDLSRCPYQDTSLVQWWHQGWEDGSAARRERHPEQNAISHCG